MITQDQWPVLRGLLAQENCAFYASEYLRGPPEPPYNGRFIAADHHIEWADLLNDHRRLCVIAPRGHGKSYFYTFAYPIWMAEKHPGRSGFIFSASQPQADEILIRIQREIESNERLQHLVPKNRHRWSSKALELANGFTLYARGYGTKVRGAHPIFIALDDVLNDETAYSEIVRKKQIDYFFSAVTNMLEPNGQIISVGTPIHAADLLGVMKNTPGYTTREYPAIRADGSALWPDRFPIKELERIRDEIKALRFAREYMCAAVTDLSSLFPMSLFKGEPVEIPNVKLGLPWQWWEERGVKDRVMGVDFALSTEIGGDYTVIFVLGLDANRNHWVIDIIRARGMSYGEQLSKIIDAARKYKPGLIFVESVQAQKIFGDELMRTTDLPIRHYVTGAEKHSLEQGLPGLRVLLENRKIRIPRGDDYSVATTDIWIEEMRANTIANGKVVSIGEHDDTAMAYWIAEQAIRAGNFGFAFGEQDGDLDADREEFELTMNPDPEDEWDDFIPGAGPRVGTNRRMTANAVETDEVDDAEDNPRNANYKPKRPGARPSAQPKDWRGKDGSPSAADIALLTSGRSW